jgi:ABC-type Fe3+/spermidine/putrescine transport system ATPase subunit
MLSVENISARFGDFSLTNVSFRVNRGEYFILLGESGAGKSLVLETIAGLRNPASGRICLNGQDITSKRIQSRNIGLVFQDYAIFPHMTVHGNLSYPLRKKKLSRKTREELINRFASKMSISHLLNRHPGTLSGGELQRLALARTLILEPAALLLDEPLSALDKRLQDEIRYLLRSLHREGQTIIHVTHDYGEAVALADQIAIIHQGRIIQTGSPEEVFQHPQNEFVAHFTGEKNFFAVTVEESSESIEAVIGNKVRIHLEAGTYTTQGHIFIRQEEIILSREPFVSTARNSFRGKIIDLIGTGHGIVLLVDIGIPIHARITAESMSRFQFRVGEAVWITWKASGIRFLPG